MSSDTRLSTIDRLRSRRRHRPRTDFAVGRCESARQRIVELTAQRSPHPACLCRASSSALVLALAPTHIQQRELLPDDKTERARRFNDAPLHPRTRGFGKFIDTDRLLPGDLILIRQLPETAFDSRLIVQMQTQGGYAPEHAQWTHAAMYLGDGIHVIEATTDNLLKCYRGDVRLTSLDRYSTGQFAIRIRRPLWIADEDRPKLCIRAMMRLRLPYDLWAALSIWINTCYRKLPLRDQALQLAFNRATICSKLYGDAYTEVTNRTFPMHAGVCVPALLSGSDLLADVEAAWVKVL